MLDLFLQVCAPNDCNAGRKLQELIDIEMASLIEGDEHDASLSEQEWRSRIVQASSIGWDKFLNGSHDSEPFDINSAFLTTGATAFLRIGNCCPSLKPALLGQLIDLPQILALLLYSFSLELLLEQLSSPIHPTGSRRQFCRSYEFPNGSVPIDIAVDPALVYVMFHFGDHYGALQKPDLVKPTKKSRAADLAADGKKQADIDRRHHSQ